MKDSLQTEFIFSDETRWLAVDRRSQLCSACRDSQRVFQNTDPDSSEYRLSKQCVLQQGDLFGVPATPSMEIIALQNIMLIYPEDGSRRFYETPALTRLYVTP